MRKLLVIILLLAISGQTFSQGWNYLGYLLQKKAYLEKCENKSRPQLHCNGKCQLMKKIAEQEKKERGEAPELKLSAKAEAAVSATFISLYLEQPTAVKHAVFIRHTIGSPVAMTQAIFHPPDLAAHL